MSARALEGTPVPLVVHEARALFKKLAKQEEADRIIAGNPDLLHFLARGGSRSGKTFYIIRAICVRAIQAPGSRHAVWRQHRNHVMSSIWADTLPKVIATCWPGLKINYNKVDAVATFPNGSEIWFGGLDDKARTEKILGQEFATIFFNEISQMGYASVLMGLTRLAQNVTVTRTGKPLRLLALYDCNPPRKTHWSYSLWFEHKDPITGRALEDAEAYATLQMNPRDNSNLPAQYHKILARMPPAERKRFEAGEYADGVEGALWTWAHFKRAHPKLLPLMRRIVIGVDPAVSANGKSNETGIIAVGLGEDGRAYVLADATIKGRPEEWARAAVNLAGTLGADAIVAEVNNGGDLVASTIRAVDKRIKVISVHASRGKYKRAEPVAALYENDLVRHVGDFGDLENQMTEFTPDFDVSVMGYSPDRADALVWAITELMLGKSKGGSRAGVSGT